MLSHPGRSASVGEVPRRHDPHGRLVDAHTLATRGQSRITNISSQYTAPDHKLSGVDSVAAEFRAPFDALLQTHGATETMRDGKTVGSSYNTIRSMVANEVATPAHPAAQAPGLMGVSATPAALGGFDLAKFASKWLARAKAGVSGFPQNCRDYLVQGRRFEIVFMAVAVVVLISVVAYTRR